MADKQFWALNEKTTDIVADDETLIIDSEDWNEVKRIKATKYKGETGDTWPQGPSGPTWNIGATWNAWTNGTNGTNGADWEDWVWSVWPAWIQWIQWVAWNDWADWASMDWTWAYNASTEYAIDEVVSYLWSSYIAILGWTWQTPDSSPTYWEVVASKWTDWIDWGNVVWPDTSTDNKLAVWDWVTWELLQDSAIDTDWDNLNLPAWAEYRINWTSIPKIAEVVASVAWTPTWWDRISKIISLTSAEYTSASKVTDTLYIITDA